MTDNVTPAARLREMSRAASPAPWRHVRLDMQVDDFAAYVAHTGNGPTSPENAALIVALRNDAEKYADLVEAAGDVLAAYDALRSGKPMPSYVSVDRLRAALAALGGGA